MPDRPRPAGLRLSWLTPPNPLAPCPHNMHSRRFSSPPHPPQVLARGQEMVNSGGELRVGFKRTGPSDTARLAELLAQAPLLASLDLR